MTHSTSLISQEHGLGCAVACVASRCKTSYVSALDLFEQKQNAWTRGFYCEEVVAALARAGMHYSFSEFNPNQHQRAIQRTGTIVFINPCEHYPAGHYLIRTDQGWMNSWSNYPQMIPVYSEIQPDLAGPIGYVIHEEL